MLDNSYYALISKQLLVVNNLNVINNNVANANTVGFKEDLMMARQYVSRDVADLHTMSGAGYTAINFANGNIKIVSNPLSCAIDGPGLFIIRMPSGVIGYTRGGSFKKSADGILTTLDDFPLLSSDGQEIVLDPLDVNVKITSDGTVLSEDGQVRGQIGLAELRGKIEKIGMSIFVSNEAGVPSEQSKIIQGAIEESNVNSLLQLTILANAQRDMGQVTHLINDGYAVERSAFKVYSRNGG